MIDKFTKKLQELYREKNYPKLIPLSVAALLASFLLIAITYYIVMHVFSFIAMRFEAVLIIVGAYVTLILWWKDKQRKRTEQEQSALSQTIMAEQTAEKALCESNYNTTRQCLYSTLSENAGILNLQKPDRLSELDSPSKTVQKGNIYMCQFVVVKNGECSPEKIKEMLQMRITQKLSAQEFCGITQTTYIYNGIAYPILCIDEVRDNGTYVQIDIAWASENYCNLLNMRAQARVQNMNPPNTVYHDGDF